MTAYRRKGVSAKRRRSTPARRHADTAAVIVAGGKGLRFGGQIRKQYLLLKGKHIGPAAAAAAGRATAGPYFPPAEGMVKYPAAKPVRHAVEEGDLPPVVVSGPLTPDDPAL